MSVSRAVMRMIRISHLTPPGRTLMARAACVVTAELLLATRRQSACTRGPNEIEGKEIPSTSLDRFRAATSCSGAGKEVVVVLVTTFARQ